MENKLDKIEEENYNNFGSKMVIVGYRKAMDIDVYFPEYNWTARSVDYGNFKKGEIKCPYEKRTYRVGFIGEGKYKTKQNGKDTKCYYTWKNMLKRCFDENFQIKRPTYKGCKVCDEWLNFQIFAEWFYNNYYEIEGETMHLDKDVLHKGNKTYSPENCMFVPERINTLFTKSNKIRGNLPIGVSYRKRNKKFRAQCNVYDLKERKRKTINLGYYETPKEAFKVYKKFKENYIKEVADHYKDRIPSKLYDALCNYEVDITD